MSATVVWARDSTPASMSRSRGLTACSSVVGGATRASTRRSTAATMPRSGRNGTSVRRATGTAAVASRGDSAPTPRGSASATMNRKATVTATAATASAVGFVHHPTAPAAITPANTTSASRAIWRARKRGIGSSGRVGRSPSGRDMPGASSAMAHNPAHSPATSAPTTLTVVRAAVIYRALPETRVT